MKRTTLVLTVIAALAAGTLASNCIMETKVVDLIVKAEAYWEFSDSSTSEVFTNTDRVAIGDEIDRALKDAGYNRADIDTATVVGASIGVTKFSHTHDWKISGSIEIERVGGAADTILTYAESVENALGKKIPLPVTPGGLAVLQQALDDYLAGANPELIYRIHNGDVDPNPSVSDPIVLDWKVWVAIQIKLQEDVELPDPF